ncbi:MAG: alanine:cation symporter family protein [Clostridia bacterium]|nr:alanine:cation symporter family protein [Clostridia bacterium]
MTEILHAISNALASVKDVIWGPLLLPLLVGGGLFLTVRSGCAQFRRFGYAMKHTAGSLFKKDQHHKDSSGVSPFQAVATALAGTIGTGSIAGIATAITAGGPGAVFWMWISALLGMVTKYCEIVLSLSFRETNEKGEWVGGPMYYLRHGLKWKKFGKVLAALFAIFAMAACLGTGNAVQSNSIADSLSKTVGINPLVTGIVLTVIVAVVILGGVRRIASVNEKLVPFMALFYVICALVALVVNIRAVPAAFALIFKEAFNFKAAVGGAMGYGIMKAITNGFSKGVFSNEAGLGSAPIAHAASSAKHPVDQGLWGMFEVFFTTIIICTISALIILTTGVYADPTASAGLDGAALSIASFNTILPGVGNVVVTLATIFFALSTILGWAYYGEVSARYLIKNQRVATVGYRIIYVAMVFVGAVSSLDAIWLVSEIMNGLMAIPNLIGLVCLSGIVIHITKDYFDGKDAEKKLAKVKK